MRNLYKDDNGKPFELTDGQAALFDCIYRRLHKKNAILTYTQYGKSETVAMATLTRATNFAERWAIIGGSKEKAEIIMQKIIKHVFDNEYCREKINLDNEDSLERLRHSKRRDKLTFKIDEGDTKRVGEIFVLSADAKSKGEDAGDILVGHGAPNIVCDDAPLMGNRINAKMMRMVGGHKDHFVLKIGNAIKNNHFRRIFEDEEISYTKIIIDHHRGILEGRQDEQFFEDMKKEYNDDILFDSFYGCIFPPKDTPLDGLWIPLITEQDIDRARGWEEKPPHAGEKKLGVDVADSGVDHDVIVQRSNNFAEILYDTSKSDNMRLAQEVTMRHEKNDAGRVYVDRVGVGSGVCSRLRSLGFKHYGIRQNEAAQRDIYRSKKAEMYWKLKKWIEEGGKLSKDKKWDQLTQVMYRTTNGRIEIMPKHVMKSMGIKSPDIADSLSFTFYHRDRYIRDEEEEKDYFFEKKMREKREKKNREKDYNFRMTR